MQIFHRPIFPPRKLTPKPAFHAFAWGGDRCAGKRQVAAMLAVGSVLILEIVPDGPRRK